MINLLFIGGGGVGSESIYKQYHNKYNLFFADAKVNNINENIPFKNKLSIPKANDENFERKVVEICNELYFTPL